MNFKIQRWLIIIFAVILIIQMTVYDFGQLIILNNPIVIKGNYLLAIAVGLYAFKFARKEIF